MERSTLELGGAGRLGGYQRTLVAARGLETVAFGATLLSFGSQGRGPYPDWAPDPEAQNARCSEQPKRQGSEVLLQRFVEKVGVERQKARLYCAFPLADSLYVKYARRGSE